MTDNVAMPTAPVECFGVVCEDTRLSEVADGQVLVSVRRQDVRQITLREGVLAPHPILQVGFGFGLVSLAYFPAAHLLHWAREGGVIHSHELWLIAGACLGIFLILTALRRGQFLEVQTAEGLKRLAFRKRTEASALNEFVKLIEQRYGLRVGRR